jgi:6,7-dimethyl-8-ribityllumazine synthase
MAQYDRVQEREIALDGKGLKIGVVRARFNHTITEGLLVACIDTLVKLGVDEADIRLVDVAGALEIPVVLKRMADSGRFDALVAIGCVIRGETYHFEVVSNESNAGITRVQLDTGVPIGNAVLTLENEDQAVVRMDEKGVDVARVAVEMACILKTL